MRVPTIFVKLLEFVEKEGREVFAWINESDFDPAKHQKAAPPGAKTAAPPPASTPAPPVTPPK